MPPYGKNDDSFEASRLRLRNLWHLTHHDHQRTIKHVKRDEQGFRKRRFKLITAFVLGIGAVLGAITAYILRIGRR